MQTSASSFPSFSSVKIALMVSRVRQVVIGLVALSFLSAILDFFLAADLAHRLGSFGTDEVASETRESTQMRDS